MLNKAHDKSSENTPDVDTFYDYFAGTSSNPMETYESVVDENMPEKGNFNTEILDEDISGAEILFAVKQIKRNKATGVDLIENDYLIDSIDIIMPLLLEHFNLVFSSGILPQSWLTGVVKAIYKGKGNKMDPRSYRHIQF